MRSWTLLGGMLGLIGVSCATSFAESKIYLAEYKYNEPKMYRMNLDGSAVEEITGLSASEWLPVGLAINEITSELYWVNGQYHDSRIRKAPLGTDVSGSQLLLSGLTNARGIDVDPGGGKMYWSDTQDDAVYRANLDGTNVETLVTGSQPGRPTLDLVNGKVYYGDYTQAVIRRCNLDGSVNEIVISDVGTVVSTALDLDSGKIYWTDSNWGETHNRIVRANLDDTGREVLIQFPGSVSSGLQDIKLDLAAGKMYWCDEITDPEKGVWRANLDGSEIEQLWATPAGWNSGAITLHLVDDECPGDIAGDPGTGGPDGRTDLADLALLLSAYGTCPGDAGYVDEANFIDDPGDPDDDCIGLEDLAFLLADYGCGT